MIWQPKPIVTGLVTAWEDKTWVDSTENKQTSSILWISGKNIENQVAFFHFPV